MPMTAARRVTINLAGRPPTAPAITTVRSIALGYRVYTLRTIRERIVE
jgi:hypothetical protein